MKVLIDSGGTRSTWVKVDGNGEVRREGPGINPYFLTEGAIADRCRDMAAALGAGTKEVFFYGAGLESSANRDAVKAGLAAAFPEASVEVYSDIFGAARALYQDSSGVVAILGTGANTCWYDGEQAEIRRPGFGFILGDEGSGAVLGVQVLRAWLYRRLPDDLKEAFETAFPMRIEDALQAVYSGEAPNRFLGSFAPFAAAHRYHPFMRELISGHFSRFYQQMLDAYAADGLNRVAFCGSVAWHFRDELEKCASEHGFEVMKIAQNPIEGLVQYHTSRIE